MTEELRPHVWGLKLNLSYVSSDVEEEFIVWASRLQSTFPSWSCCGAESALITSLQSDSGCVRWNECEAFTTSHFTSQMFWQLNVTIRLFYQKISTFYIFLTFYRKMWKSSFYSSLFSSVVLNLSSAEMTSEQFITSQSSLESAAGFRHIQIKRKLYNYNY